MTKYILPNRILAKKPFVPEGDLHELGLLFYSYILQVGGFKVIYLGQSVPATDVLSVAKTYNCTLFVSSVINPGIQEEFTATIKNLFKQFPEAKLYLAGSQKEAFLGLNPSIYKIESAADLLSI